MPLQVLNYVELIKKIDTWGRFMGYLYNTKQFDKAKEFSELIDPIIDKCLRLNMYRDPYEEENPRK